MQPRSPRLAVVVSRYNREVTDGLLSGVREYLAERSVTLPEDAIIDAPGAFEIPLIAQAAARSGRFDGVICLGCVVKGETAHFEYISQAASHGILNASLSTGIPIAFGILTTFSDEQALARSRPGPENKGREAASACLDSIRTLGRLAALTDRPDPLTS